MNNVVQKLQPKRERKETFFFCTALAIHRAWFILAQRLFGTQRGCDVTYKRTCGQGHATGVCVVWKSRKRQSNALLTYWQIWTIATARPRHRPFQHTLVTISQATHTHTPSLHFFLIRKRCSYIIHDIYITAIYQPHTVRIPHQEWPECNFIFWKILLNLMKS